MSEAGRKLNVPALIAKIWIWVASLTAALSMVVHMFIGLDNDTLTLFKQTSKMLAGGRPYIDFNDVDPPLVHLIFVLPITFSDMSGMPHYLSLNLFSTVLTLFALWLCHRMMLAANSPALTRRLTISSIALALFGASFMHQAYADREYLLLMFITPFLLSYSPLVALEKLPRGMRITSGIMAAFGFALKPYVIALYVCAMLYRLLFTRLRIKDIFYEIEPYILAGAAVFYIGIVLLFFGEYIFTILPIGAKTYSALAWAWSSQIDIIRTRFFMNYGVTGLASAVLLAIFAPRAYRPVIFYTFFLVIGAIGSYLLGYGWYYTQYPMIATSLLFAVAAGGRLIAACETITAALLRRIAYATVISGLCVGLGFFFAVPVFLQAKGDIDMMRWAGRPMNTSVMNDPAWNIIQKQLVARPRFLLLSTNLWTIGLLKEGSNRESVGRFEYLWPLPGAHYLQQKPETKEEGDKIAQWLGDGVAEDISTRHPDIILIDMSPYQRALPTSYKLLDFFNQSERFRTALAGYRLEEIVDECEGRPEGSNCAYEVYYPK